MSEARQIIDALESPQAVLRSQPFTVQSGMQFWTVNQDGSIADSRSVPGTSYHDLAMVDHFDVQDYAKRVGYRPIGTIQLKDIAYWTKYSGQRVPAGMRVNRPKGYRNPM